TMSKFIYGCGYLGLRVARLWRERGDSVAALTRSAGRANDLQQHGIVPVVGDITDSGSLSSLDFEQVDTVLFAVGFDRQSGKSIEEVYVDGLRNVLAVLPDSISRFVYISTTGVYGQSDGQVVDEDSPCDPRRPGGKACLAAEQMIQAHGLAEKSIILRLAGIYGPDRVPRKKDLMSGRLEASTRGHLNLIHVEDAAEVVLADESSTIVPAIYVVSDGNPVPRLEYYQEICKLLNLHDVELVDPPVDSPAGQRALADKRICSDLMRKQLDVTLRFPSFREGLAAILASE
ncbi:MAG: SDR family oxidoreductase, partial [Planctomycetota bacterium]